MTEKTTPGTGLVCQVPGCERPADPETEPLEVCREHWASMEALSDVEAWSLALGVLKPWVETTEAIGFDKLTEVMERALAEAEAEADLARHALMEAEAAL